MKRILFLTAAVIAATLGLALPAHATTDGYADTQNESSVHDSRGDITWVGATYSPTHSVGLGMSTAVQDHLSSPNWVNDSVVVSWDIATPSGTYSAWFWDATRGSVLDPSSHTVCSFTPDQTDNGLYFAGFPGSCIGSPASFKIRGYIHYDDAWGTGSSSYDFAPNIGNNYCCEVTPDATPDPTPAPPTQPDPAIQIAGSHDGYWMLTQAGSVSGFGTAHELGPIPSTSNVHIEPTRTGNGYWVINTAGFVTAVGDAQKYGEATMSPGEKAVSLSASPSGNGYWVFTDKGRVLPYGDAQFFGDMSQTPLNGPILGSVATSTGNGYWMVGSDGGIFSFGDAKFHGSTGNLALNKPVMAMAPAPDGSGYWLVASDGGIFAFDVPFYGSMGGKSLNKPISGMVPGRGGYMMVAEDGGVFSFGSVSFKGSLGATPPASPVISVALQP